MALQAVVAAVTVVSAIGQYENSKKAAESQQEQVGLQKQAMAAEKQRADIANVRNVRQQIRQTRMAQSSMLNQAALAGGIGGSGYAGGSSSLGSQMAGNLGYMSDIAGANQNIYNAQMGALDAQSASIGYQQEASLWGSVGSLSGAAFKGYTGQSVGEYFGAYAKKKGWG